MIKTSQPIIVMKLKQIRKDQSVDPFSENSKQIRKVQSRSQTQIIVKINIGRIPNRVNNFHQQENSGRLRGIRKGSGRSSFKAVKRTVDVFVGRFDEYTTTEIIHDYVKDNFSVNCVKIEIFKIKTELYNAFKITVSLVDWDLLLNGNL